MDLSSFKLDIDELVGEFSQEGLTRFADMKRIWLSRKFSFIYEGRPKRNSALFMQGLYAHCIGHMNSADSLSHRLGGLYCLYCVYETQPYRPFFKIYISIADLKRLKELIIDSKQKGIGIVPALVKRMLRSNMFLFGSVDRADTSLAHLLDDITKLNDKRIQVAQQKLFANTRIEDYLHMDLGDELDLEVIKKMSLEYTREKKLAIQAASGRVGVDDIKHIAEDNRPMGEAVNDIVKQWDSQRDLFYAQTGVNHKEVERYEDFDRSWKTCLMKTKIHHQRIELCICCWFADLLLLVRFLMLWGIRKCTCDF